MSINAAILSRIKIVETADLHRFKTYFQVLLQMSVKMIIFAAKHLVMKPKEYAKLVRITEIVCEHFGCEKDLISEKQGDYLRYSTARHFIWYLAHYSIPVVVNELSLVFKRKPNAIKKGIAKISFGVLHERYYQKIYMELIKKLEIPDAR